MKGKITCAVLIILAFIAGWLIGRQGPSDRDWHGGYHDQFLNKALDGIESLVQSCKLVSPDDARSISRSIDMLRQKDATEPERSALVLRGFRFARAAACWEPSLKHPDKAAAGCWNSCARLLQLATKDADTKSRSMSGNWPDYVYLGLTARKRLGWIQDRTRENAGVNQEIKNSVYDKCDRMLRAEYRDRLDLRSERVLRALDKADYAAILELVDEEAAEREWMLCASELDQGIGGTGFD